MTALGLEEKREVARALLASALSSSRAAPLSYAQEQLWVMDKLQPGTPVYNIPLYVTFDGRCDVPAMQAALEMLTRRHDMLRVHFDSVDGQPRQIVEPDAPVVLPFEDLAQLTPSRRRAAVDALLIEEVRRPFDLSTGCVRYRAIRVDPDQHFLCVTMHHIVTDAWSLGVFVSELKALYGSLRSGHEPPSLPPLPVGYADYAQWQRRTLRGPRLSRLVKYWTRQLAGIPPILQLPIDRPRQKDQTFNGTMAAFVFDDELSAALIRLTRDNAVTSFIALLACYYVLLFHYTGQEDLVVGAPVANRAYPEIEPIIGLFVNSVVLRVGVHEEDPFTTLLGDVNRVSLDAFEHQAMPFDKLVQELGYERSSSHPPVFQAVFNFQNVALIGADAPSAEGEAIVTKGMSLVHSNTAKVDLNLTLTQSGSSFSGGIEYNTDLFDASTIEDMIARYTRIVRAAVADPDRTIGSLAFEDDGEAVRTRSLDTEEQFDFEVDSP